MERIIKGDKVKVIAGRYKGQTGNVLAVFPKTKRVKVEKINLVKKHIKAGKGQEESGIVEQELPIPLSNVVLLDSKAKDDPTKVSYLFDNNNKKFRANRKTQTSIVNKK